MRYNSDEFDEIFAWHSAATEMQKEMTKEWPELPEEEQAKCDYASLFADIQVPVDNEEEYNREQDAFKLPPVLMRMLTNFLFVCCLVGHLHYVRNLIIFLIFLFLL